MMNLIKFKHRKDFGNEFYIQVLNTSKHWMQPLKDRSLLQISVSWNDYASWPYVQITSGMYGIFGLMCSIHRIGFDLDLLSRTWSFDHLEKIDDGHV